ncbi:MAG TPA: TonB-dependent receptor [Steroidobacteraceae bacterium]|nr:TonB-dependent receptor [Steroidobacteraceae bacterium]
MRSSYLFSTLIAASFATCIADAAAADTGSLDTVVVTATRLPTPESQVASSITVIDASDIAAMQSQTLPDVLKAVPGLNVVQIGGPGGQTSVFMRGTNSNHVKVLVDGIDVSDPSSAVGAFDFGQFLTQDIQKVEVLRGPQSGLYGSDAIGGVINVITKAGSGPAQFAGGIEAGSFDTFNQNAGISGSAQQFHYVAAIQHLHAGETPVTPLDALLPGERRIDDYYDNLTASTKLGYDVSDTVDLGLVARYTDTHLRNTGDNEFNFPDTFPDSAQSTSNTTQYYTRATAHNVAFDGLLDHTLGVAYSNIKSTGFSPDNGPSENAGNRLKFDWQGNIRLSSDEHLVLGAEHQRDAISQPISASTTINSGYAELQSAFGESFFDTISARYDDNDRFGSKITYRVAPVFLIKDSGTKLKASVGTGFKAPTLSEMFQSFPPFFFANPNLRPETSLGYDVGFEQALFAETVHFGATYFRNNIKNLISSNADFTSDANVGRARTDGVESFVSYQPIRAYTARLDYTYTEAFDQVANTALLRRPKHKASLRNSWQATEQLSFDATILYVGSWVDGNRDFTNLLPLNAPSFTTVNLAANYDLSDKMSVYGRINNLLDRKYEDPIGFLQPSLGAFAGVKVKF